VCELNVYVCVCGQQLVKSFEVCDLPVRASKFVSRKNWVITGSVSNRTQLDARIFLHFCFCKMLA